MAEDEVSGVPSTSAAAKKKLRRKKAKEGKKQLKEISKLLHEALHDAQQTEAKHSKATARVSASTLLQSKREDTEHSVVYVAEPLTGLDELSQKVQQAAIDQNPYEGVSGMEVDGAGQQAALEELQRIAQHFSGAEQDGGDEQQADELKTEPSQPEVQAVKTIDVDEDVDPNQEKSNREIKRERNEHTSLMISQLKQDCPRPEVVEVWDIRARDPKLLVYLKSYRNTIPVPRHWSQKRKYLQGKRGIEKPPFELPSFIGATGISDMRNALEEKVQERLKNKGKQRMRPKMGKMDIDYSILHDAFFKYQDKPKMAKIGDLYYEGKEYEMKPSNAYPGMFSDELKTALGMSEGAPPPWLINMQRYGPPPSYPSLEIPGLNAPIPAVAEFGYHPGGWGKPPVDPAGNPLYGDVFGVLPQQEDDLEPEVKLFRWGELEEEDEETSEEEEPEEPEGAEPAMTQEQLEQGIASGMVTGLASSLTEAGIGTNQTLDMRKASGTSTSGPTPALYTVLEQQKAQATDGLAAVDHTYKLPPNQRPANPATRKRLEALHGGQAGDVDVAIDPEVLEKKGLDALYQQAGGAKESYVDMVADNAAARKRKLEGQAGKGSKKSKEAGFKF